MKITPALLLAASLFCFVVVVARNDDTGLFHEEADYDAGHVLKYHHNGTFKSPNRQKRRLPPVRLAYVTPWNKLGYTRVLEHPAAFTHVSPCWFEAQRDAAAAVLSPGKPAATVVNGAGHINATWGFRLSETGVKVLPRVLVNLGDLGADVFTSAAASQAFSKSVTKAVLGPDAKLSKWVSGIVLDWGGFPLSNAQLAPPEGVKRFLTDLRQTLSETSDKDDFLIVLVIPPDANAIQPKQYKWLHPLVDYFQVMTYDFNGGATAPKENAPMTWVETVIRSILRVKKESPTEPTKNDAFPRSKLLMGVNLYGARFTRGGKPRETLDGKGWIKLLTEERKMAKALNPNITKKELDGRPALVWGSETCEHSAELYVPKSGVEFVFYPSIAGLLHRVHYATVIGLGGVAAWELGQGLEYFTPVFEP